MFPVVLRSDNAQYFTGSVMAEINKLLGINHITGSAYHPQSQGMVESMHKTLNHLVRGLVQDHPEDWETRIPFAQAILRIMPLAALGGRSPYEVVTGLRPKLPSALDPNQRVEHVNVSEYCTRLRTFFDECYKSVERVQRDVAERNVDEAPGLLSKELEVGDLVLIRVPPTVRLVGPLRFQRKTLPDVYRLTKKITRNTFDVEAITAPGAPVSFVTPIHAERLVKLDMPELDLRPNQERYIEIHDNSLDEWNRYKIERYAIDGRVFIRRESDPNECEWIDLSTKRYRWVYLARANLQA
jgi:hypothetical protein